MGDRNNSRINPVTAFGEQEGLILECNNNKYEIRKIIGSGAFGVVVLAIDKTTNEIVAIKRVIQDRRYKNRELDMLEKLHHKNVLSIQNHFYSKVNFTDDLCLNIVMDYYPQNLHELLKEYYHKQFPINYTRVFSYQLARALAYIHTFNMCHRDLKPQNILVNKDTGELKLCDFGTAKILSPTESNISYICSRYYRAPELIFGATSYTTAVDIWAFGCVVAEMMLTRPLFQGENASDQLNKIMRVIGSPSSMDVKAMNKLSPYTRIPPVSGAGIENVLRSTNAPTEVIIMLFKILQYAPKSRPTAIQLLTYNFHRELFKPNCCLPNGNKFPILSDFTNDEIELAKENNLINEFEKYKKQENDKYNNNNNDN